MRVAIAIAASIVAQSKSLTDQGEAALRAGDLATAKDALDKAVAVDPSDHVAWYFLGKTLHASGDDAGAEHAFAQARGLAPDALAYRVADGLALAAIGRTGDAIVLLEPALAEQPSLAEVPAVLGKLEEDQRAHAKAAAAYSVGCGFAEPGTCAPLASLYLRWRYVDEAIQVAAQAAGALTGDDLGDVELVLGRAWMAKHRTDDAIAAFGAALAARPGLIDARFERGMAYLAKGDRDDATPDLEAYLKEGQDEFRLAVARQALSTR